MAKQVAKKQAATNKPANKQQVARTTGKAVAESNVDMMLMMRQDAGKGVSTSSEDNILPLIKILQSGTPQALRQKTEYIKGAVAGNIWPRGTQILIDGDVGMPVIPCGMRKWWMEWGPEQGDGLKGRHEYIEAESNRGRPSDAIQVEDPKTGAKIWVRKETDNQLVETREHAVLAFIEGQWRPGVVTMKGADHTCSRTWNGEMLNKRFDPPNDDFIPPACAFVYNLKTVAKTNDKGDWFGWAFENGMGDGEKTPVQSLEGGVELYRMARAMHDSFMSGAKVAADDDDAPVRDSDDGKDL